MASEYEYTSRVKFEILVENSGGRWDGKESLADMHKAAIDNARRTLAQLIGREATGNLRNVAARHVTPGSIVSVEVIPVKVRT